MWRDEEKRLTAENAERKERKENYCREEIDK
jgi:hypothetical protein